MTFPEFQIQLDLNPDNQLDVLKNADTCRWINDYGYIFVDSENGQCYLFDEDGNLDDINKVKWIADGVFWRCTSLITIKIPDSIKSIRAWAFDSCTSLTSIEIPNSIKSIGDVTFWRCTSLTSIKIPDSVEWIGYWVFRDCNSLKEIVFKGKTMKQVKAMKNYPWGISNESIQD